MTHREMKEGRTFALPFLSVENALEIDAEAELDPARTGNAVRRNQLRVDDAECSRVGGVKGRVKEIGMVEDIEKVEREFGTDSFRNGSDLAEAHVEIPVAEAAKRTVATIV